MNILNIEFRQLFFFVGIFAVLGTVFSSILEPSAKAKLSMNHSGNMVLASLSLLKSRSRGSSCIQRD